MSTILGSWVANLRGFSEPDLTLLERPIRASTPRAPRQGVGRPARALIGETQGGKTSLLLCLSSEKYA